MTPQEIETKIREGFNREFQGTQDSRSELHASFSKQGIKLLDHRKELIKTVAIISTGLIATPKFLDITPDPRLYFIGLSLLIATILFSLLNSRENIDIDEARTVFVRSKLLPILDRRIEKLKEYLSKSSFNADDLRTYQEYRESEDSSEEMKKLKSENDQELENIPIKAIDYASSLVMLLFISGTFFISVSMVLPSISLFGIACVEILIISMTITNFSNKILIGYSKLVTSLKKKVGKFDANNVLGTPPKDL